MCACVCTARLHPEQRGLCRDTHTLDLIYSIVSLFLSSSTRGALSTHAINFNGRQAEKLAKTQRNAKRWKNGTRTQQVCRWSSALSLTLSIVFRQFSFFAPFRGRSARVCVHFDFVACAISGADFTILSFTNVFSFIPLRSLPPCPPFPPFPHHRRTLRFL